MAQVAAVTGTVAVVTVGGIVGRALTENPALATLPISLLIVGTALCTVLASWTMARLGRARGFALGAGAGALGSGLAIAAIATQSFVLFCAATVMVGCAAAFSQQYRFAAMESVSQAAGPKAVSVVLVGVHVGRRPRPRAGCPGRIMDAEHTVRGCIRGDRRLFPARHLAL